MFYRSKREATKGQWGLRFGELDVRFMDENFKDSLTALLRSILCARPDVALLHGWPGKFVALPLFFKFAGIPFLLRGDANDKRKLSALHLLRNQIFLRMLIRQATAVVAIGTSNRSFWKRFGAADGDIFFSPFCVDTDYWFAQAAKTLPRRSEIRRRLGLDDRVVVLSVGRNAYIKGFDTLAKAVKQIPKAILVLVGDGANDVLVERIIEEHQLEGRVKKVSFVQQDELAEHYAAADVFVLTSRHEPWGLVINEAMHFGLPIIATSVCGAVDDLVVDGVNGFVVPPEDHENLADRLGELLRTPSRRRRMGLQSRRIITDWNIDRATCGLWRAILYSVGRRRQLWAGRS